jgi:hypothetical protein
MRAAVAVLETRRVTSGWRSQMRDTLHEAFEVPPEAHPLDQYFDEFERVAVVHRHDQVLGFQFFRQTRVGRAAVHHFGLAASRPETGLHGLQHRVGMAILTRILLGAPPWSTAYMTAITNSARSYANLYSLGRIGFPDVMRPGRANPIGAFYHQIAEALGVPRPDERGVIARRMESRGFSLRPDPADGHPLATAYADYVAGSLGDGLFTVVQVTPAIDAPRFLMTRWRKRLR